MLSKSFKAVIRNGKLEHNNSLTEFEGRRVYITVIAIEPENTTAKEPEKTAFGDNDLGLEMV